MRRFTGGVRERESCRKRRARQGKTEKGRGGGVWWDVLAVLGGGAVPLLLLLGTGGG